MAQVLERTGDARNAARAYRNALAHLAPGTAAPESVAVMIEHARAAVATDDAALAGAIEERLAADTRAPWRRVVPPGRALASICLTGRRTRFTPQPTFMYFPGDPAVEFFERSDFTWLDAIEAATARSRRAHDRAGLDREGLEPYIAYPEAPAQSVERAEQVAPLERVLLL